MFLYDVRRVITFQLIAEANQVWTSLCNLDDDRLCSDCKQDGYSTRESIEPKEKKLEFLRTLEALDIQLFLRSRRFT
jgi:hypothetical protein